MRASDARIRNPLLDREPELVQRLAAFRDRVNDMLFDQLAAAALINPGFRAGECPHPAEEVRATAQILRVLTKDVWDADDLRIFDACWQQAAYSDLFAEEFEPERHRIRHAVEDARRRFLARGLTSR